MYTRCNICKVQNQVSLQFRYFYIQPYASSKLKKVDRLRMQLNIHNDEQLPHKGTFLLLIFLLGYHIINSDVSISEFSSRGTPDRAHETRGFKEFKLGCIAQYSIWNCKQNENHKSQNSFTKRHLEYFIFC